MSVRNIDKGYIGTDSGAIDVSGYVTLPVTFTQPFTMTVNATFMKKNGIWLMTLPPVMGAPLTSDNIIAYLPSSYQAIDGLFRSLFTPVSSYSVLGTNPGKYPGFISIYNNSFALRTSGKYVVGSTPQGLPNSTTIVYLTNL